MRKWQRWTSSKSSRRSRWARASYVERKRTDGGAGILCRLFSAVPITLHPHTSSSGRWRRRTVKCTYSHHWALASELIICSAPALPPCTTSPSPTRSHQSPPCHPRRPLEPEEKTCNSMGADEPGGTEACRGDPGGSLACCSLDKRADQFRRRCNIPHTGNSSTSGRRLVQLRYSSY